jgi:cation diffusion facilitator family transporter
VGILTGSLGILSEALHSGLDLVAAVITYFSVKVSDNPPDEDHNFGHGKIENISALVETILLLITCVWIIYEATHRLLAGDTIIEVTKWSYIVVIASIIIDIGRSRALSRVAKKYNSQALEADALHFSTDIWSSAVVLFGLICANMGFFFADCVAALIVAGIVIMVSYKLGKRSIYVLLDTAPKDKVIKIKEILNSIPEIKKYHSLRVRPSGADLFVNVVLNLNPKLTCEEIHRICDKTELKISKSIDRCEVFVHVEPLKKL